MRIQIPKLIKVICSEVEPSHSSSGFQKILNVFTPNTNQKGSYIHKKFQNLIFHNTNIKDLTRLNIKLIDEDDEPLNLDLGVPTYIKMQFQQHQNTEELSIFLDSRKTNFYQENKADDFKF